MDFFGVRKPRWVAQVLTLPQFHGWVVRFTYYQDQAFALPRHRLTGSGRKTSHPGHLQAYTRPLHTLGIELPLQWYTLGTDQ